MKKIYCVIFSVMLVVFTMIPVTAFAYTGAANANYRLIAENADIIIPDDYKYYVVYTAKDKKDFVYCVFSNSNKFYCKSYIFTDSVTDKTTTFYDFAASPELSYDDGYPPLIIVKYNYDNIYKNPTLICDKGIAGHDYLVGPTTGERKEVLSGYPWGINKNSLVVHYCNFDFNNAGKTFTQTPSTPTTPGTEGEITPGAAVLGATMKKTNLSQVLSELIAVLPILLPVLITFIAIRKGIKFILGTLRTA